ncbi:hypothetical protein DFA_07972 [Cavenderia fasciculata]|uniref:Transmembrane protein n=1 Tax=Cavenderia fasciculata TaxID=261658 RepID=F4Q4C9_CACFS|nr:uncharacterized protein DFA_07972 [Cavenderia fasciculata]EGG16991.1 hypothetical protein DFA_07972 [Cavenderia fasciculata]|eukprot:XP_004355475.1 hypothetical protein DFA_07972 [Cavenderia fasciculata]
MAINSKNVTLLLIVIGVILSLCGGIAESKKIHIKHSNSINGYPIIANNNNNNNNMNHQNNMAIMDQVDQEAPPPPPNQSCSQCLMGYICLNNTCSNCFTDSQCQSQVSSQSVCAEGICEHKSLFHDHFTFLDIVGLCLLFIGCALSSGGGVGGGGIYIPILILVSKFSPKTAIPLSNCLVAGCAMANFIQNFPRRHPFANKHLIDYSVVLLIEPLTLGGTTFGVYLHTFLPPFVILILLVVTLTATAITTFRKGLSIYKKENETKSYSQIKNTSINSDGSETQQSNPFKDAEWGKISAIVLVLALSTVFSVLKGGDGEYSMVGIKLCSPTYWTLSFAIWPVIIVTWILTALYLYRRWKKNQLQGIKVEGDINYSPQTIILLGFLSVIAGILASLLGIGGGMIKGPVLLQMGLSPDITAATSSFMILFTSASSAIQYVLLGKLRLDYGLVYYFTAFIACFVGTQSLLYAVKKSNRKSYFIFLICLVIVISTILLCITEVIDLEKYKNQPFISVCTPNDAPAS